MDANNIIKISDFGLAEDIYSQNYFRQVQGGIKLPLKWMALESIKLAIFSEKTDVVSIVRPHFLWLMWEQSQDVSTKQELHSWLGVAHTESSQASSNFDLYGTLNRIAIVEPPNNGIEVSV